MKTKIYKYSFVFALFFMMHITGFAQSNPVAVDDTAIIRQYYQEWINVIQNDFDPDEDLIEVFEADWPAEGHLITFNDSMIHYKCNNYFGWDSLKYKIRKKDNIQYQDSAWLYIQVLENELPVVQNDTFPIMVGETLDINIYDHAFDPDGDEFILDKVSSPRNGKANELSDSTFWVTFEYNYSGLDSLSIRLEEVESG